MWLVAKKKVCRCSCTLILDYLLPPLVLLAFTHMRREMGSVQLDTNAWRWWCCTERKPVDPPPIVQLRVREEGSYLAQ